MYFPMCHARSLATLKVWQTQIGFSSIAELSNTYLSVCLPNLTKQTIIVYVRIAVYQTLRPVIIRNGQFGKHESAFPTCHSRLVIDIVNKAGEHVCLDVYHTFIWYLVLYEKLGKHSSAFPPYMQLEYTY